MLDASSGAYLEVFPSSSPDAPSPDSSDSFTSIRLQCELQSSVCASTPVTCISDVDVSHLISSEQGGSIYIHTRMNIDNVIGAYTPCMHKGHKNVEHALSARLTSSLPVQSTSSPTLSSSSSSHPREDPTGPIIRKEITLLFHTVILYYFQMY